MSRVVLVTGAAGEVGRRLCRRLVAAGWGVRALVLPGDPLRARLDGLACDIREGDIRDPDSLRARGGRSRHGVSSGGGDPGARSQPLRNRQPPGDRAHGRRGGGGGRPAFYLRFVGVGRLPAPDPYGKSKLAAERRVQAERRFAHTIVRPTLVYDESGGQEFMIFREHLRRFPIVPFIGSGSALKRPVFSEDVVDGLARMAGNQASFGKTYNLSGGEAITLDALARLILDLSGRAKADPARAGDRVPGAGDGAGMGDERSPDYPLRHRGIHQRRRPGPGRRHRRSRL